MMTRTHAMTAITVWLAGDILTRVSDSGHPYAVTLAGAAIAWGSAIVPDIDTPDSRLGRRLPRLSSAISAVCGGHRGATHWAVTALMIGAVTGLLAWYLDPSLWWVGLAVTTGWGVHLAGDCCTYRGVPLWGPVSRAPVRLPYGWRIASSGRGEHRVYVVARVLAMVLWVLSSAYAI